MLVEVDALTHRIAGRVVLAVERFALGAGEHALILGPSGSGKTTLINALTGLITPTEGRVRIDGEAMSEASPARRDALRRRAIGLVFQTLRLVSALSVIDNLRLASRLATGGVDDAAVRELVSRVGLTHRAHARPRELSQGEAQRAAIARALVARPRLLIADEPTSALDDANAARIVDLLIETAAAHGSTLVVATHDGRIRHRFGRTLELAPPMLQVAA